MNAPLSAAAHPYETRFSMEEIQRSIASIQDDKLIFLQVQSNEMGDVIVESMGEISVGLQKIIYCIEEFRSIEQCCVYTSEIPNTSIRLYLSNNLDEGRMSSLSAYFSRS
ncbi:unnamed protein product [Rotaria socialis]|uniref:Uncharacterized protein n=1 Tax=Rotaria socialis TaxID=392032 RepID=A0A818KIT0_9BILA|nr:unnamed protein product [Rotaria socialis]CAF4602600.1 unnamed protein product [Rotaria socialis]